MLNPSAERLPRRREGASTTKGGINAMAEAVAEQACCRRRGAAGTPRHDGAKRARADDAVAPTAPYRRLALPLQAIMRIESRACRWLHGGRDKEAFGKICSLFILYLSTMCAHASRPPPARPHFPSMHPLQSISRGVFLHECCPP